MPLVTRCIVTVAVSPPIGKPPRVAPTLHSFDVIEALGLARPHLVGHSMGGMIAAEMAAVAPLYRIRARTVIVWGEDDRMIPPVYGEAFRRGVAGTELVMVPAAGHMVIVEKAESVVAALARLD